jgi:hypothetical protein
MRAAGRTSAVEQLEALGVRGVLWQLAKDGQIVGVRCEMPQCYCFPIGLRRPTTTRGSSRMEGSSLRTTSGWRIGSATDVTSGWRMKINAMLGRCAGT